ncbi:MAG: O-antigen ligase family protein [Pseudooceanicola sp.]
MQSTPSGHSPNQAAMSQLPGPKLPFLFYVVFLALFMPVFFDIGSLHMSASRLVLLFLTPIMFLQLFSGRAGKVQPTDVMILLFMIWFAISIFVNNRSAFVTFVGSNMLILFGGYLAGRVYVRGPRAFRQMVFLYGGLVLFTLPFALYESRTSVMWIARMIDQLPMVSSSQDVDYPQRHGLYRVQVIFTHPIHYGLFNTVCFAYVMVGLRDQLKSSARWMWAGVILLCCFLSVSSGPLLGIIAQIALIMYAQMTRGVKIRWKVLMGTLATLYVLLDILSSRPAYYAIIERLAFNSGTAYVRKILLEYGTAQIARTPVFGVGYNTWDLPAYMTGSLDNYWLMTALVYGLPALVFLAGAYLYTLIKAGRVDLEGDREQTNMRLGWSISTVGTMLSLATVAVWSEMASLIFLTLGCGVWLLEAKARRTGEESTLPDTPPERRNQFTRFPQHAGVGGPAFSRSPAS